MRSTEDQVQDCRTFCESRGWRVIETIVDSDRSASEWARREREGFAAVLDLVRRGQVNVVVMWESSRAARKMAGYLELRDALRKAGVLLAYSGRIFDLRRGDDAFTTGLDALVAERDASAIRDRIVRTKRLDAARGHPAGMLPYGYKRHYHPVTRALLSQYADEHQATVVLHLAERVLAGASLNSLARDLNARGEPTPKPPRRPDATRGWTANTIRQILLGPAVAGLRKHTVDGRVILYPAEWPAIVDEPTWRAIGLVFDDESRVIIRGTKPKHLLSHVARCGICGVPLRHCKNAYSCPGCFGVYASAGPVDALVEATLVEYLSRPENLAQISQDEHADMSAEVSAAQEHVRVIEARLEGAAEAYRQGEWSTGMLARVERGLQADLVEARAAATIRVADPVLQRLADSDDVEREWLDLDLGEKRRVLRAVLDIRIDRAKHRGGRSFDTERVRITRA